MKAHISDKKIKKKKKSFEMVKNHQSDRRHNDLYIFVIRLKLFSIYFIFFLYCHENKIPIYPKISSNKLKEKMFY